MKWQEDFEERELSEILFAMNYVGFYNHGTAGHLSYNIISKMADKLDELEDKLDMTENYDDAKSIVEKLEAELELREVGGMLEEVGEENFNMFMAGFKDAIDRIKHNA